MHFLENFLELVRFLNYSEEEDQIHMSQFLIRTDADGKSIALPRSLLHRHMSILNMV